MKLCIMGRTEDVEQMVAPMITERGEKLQITITPGPRQDDGTLRYYVEVERKKKIGKREDGLV